jgi:mannosylglycerate hydrolase
VRLIDKVLAMMDADERFVFTLDGQLQTVDDYLEIRPENEERIRALVEEGRLAVGPWQVLMDEFLVSGETIWRNLERGLARGDELGGSLRVGYLPDMFGHIAQMPQILRAFGLDNAVVWRGVPSVVDSHRFEWRGIDGSSVAAEYLPEGYGNGAHLLLEPDRLRPAMAALIETMRPWFGDDPVLAMYGTDHQEPLPELMELVEKANADDGDVRIDVVTLRDVVTVPEGVVTGGPTWSGEMRSGARANLLMNVTSARMDIKAAAARAERALERYAEPFAALHGTTWPQDFLDVAWARVIENSAHDSVCGCSADAVSAQVLVRYAEAEQVAHELVREAFAGVREATPRSAFAVANPSPFRRRDLIEVDVQVPEEWEAVSLELADGSRAPTQELERNEPQLHRVRVRGSEIPALLRRRAHGRELFGRWLNGFTVDEGPTLVLDLDTEQDPAWLDIAALRSEIEAAARGQADAEWDLIFRTRPRRRLLARVSAPPLGWTGARATEGAAASEHAVEADERSLANGLITVEVAQDGTFSVGAVAGAGRIVRGFDVGDSYNYGPPSDDVLVSEPESVDGRPRESGPLRGTVSISRTYRWLPDHIVPIETELELRAGEPFVRVRISFLNPAADQRVRVHLPLPREADRSYAEGQYAVVERPPVAEGGHGEVPLPTYPASSFVAAGGLAVLLDHVSEYELIEGRELALTVLRSTGWISRNQHPYREDPAGPEIEIPDAQMRGPWTFSFALYPYEGERPGPDVLEQAERYRLPFLAFAGAGEREALREREGPAIGGEGVVLAALRRRGEKLEARIVNETDGPRSVPVALETVDLRPWEIRTLDLGHNALDLSR